VTRQTAQDHAGMQLHLHVVRISKANKSVRAKADRIIGRGFAGGGRGVLRLLVRGRGC
jgi:hypothetical protein